MQNAANNLQTQAYELIKNKIIRAEYTPGQKIVEKEVEATINIGRTPVREALIHLRRDGLINVVPQSGTSISLIDMHAATSARFVRESIEKKVVMEAGNQMNTLNAASFDQILQQQKLQIESRNVPAFFAADEAFHRKFYEITDKILVWDWLQIVNIHLNRFRWLRLKVAELNWDTLIEQHQHILDAVQHHNVEEAGFLASQHLHLMLEEQQTLLEKFPEYFIERQD
ncbi:GntR family transcriptional regulator [Paucilactobacillus wasatchensis]|uniref:Transcriptional regulator, GntR family n=1 Tax=Paucilactobacillus wasatchensis TaxID=1335616 RepID=A0A0D1A5R8_9LACO|nr:GntR family transcriptional regulator [Paucilactobacillus wasatchensis]KIS03235.1 Transcriptional regulator, GntR family [Paucilactobacillus wasatchensis]